MQRNVEIGRTSFVTRDEQKEKRSRENVKYVKLPSKSRALRIPNFSTCVSIASRSYLDDRNAPAVRKEKDAHEFKINTGRIIRTCIPCWNTQHEWRESNADKVQRTSREWMARNQERIQLYKKSGLLGVSWEKKKAELSIPERKVPMKHPHVFEDGVEKKWCARCKEHKSLSSFTKSCKRLDSLLGICKECVQARNKENGNARSADKRKYQKQKATQNPSRFCQHGNQRSSCMELPCKATPSIHRCVSCQQYRVNGKRGDYQSQLCANCKGRDAYLRKYELRVQSWLDETQHEYIHNKKIPNAPTTRFPDFRFVAVGFSVILEVDEYEHRYNQAECEIARISELFDALPGMSLHLIRYNPHSKVKKEELLEALDLALENDFGSFSETGIVVQYLGYGRDRILKLDELTCELQS